MDASNLTFYEQEQLLNFFSHYMSQSTRRELMRQLPAAYNSWCGREVVRSYAIDESGLYNRPLLGSVDVTAEDLVDLCQAAAAEGGSQ